MKLSFGIALKEKPLDEGLTKEEILDLFDLMHGVVAIPMDVRSGDSAAMGFINRTDAGFLGHDLDPVSDFIRILLEDSNLASDDGTYIYTSQNGSEIDIYLSRR